MNCAQGKNKISYDKLISFYQRPNVYGTMLQRIESLIIHDLYHNSESQWNSRLEVKRSKPGQDKT